jgi:hypothetical protein
MCTHGDTLPAGRQFQSQQHQTTVGPYGTGACWRDPTIGLWTQPDTVVPDPMYPPALSRYGLSSRRWHIADCDKYASNDASQILVGYWITQWSLVKKIDVERCNLFGQEDELVVKTADAGWY